MKVFNEFYISEEFYKHLNNIYNTLIPKKKNASDLKDYHPISLLSNVLDLDLPS